MTDQDIDDPRLPDWNLGERLYKSRSTAGLSPDDMADRLGCSERTIRNYERGATSPKRSTLLAWSTVTDMPLWWLEDAPEGGVTIGEPEILVAA